MEQTSFNSSPMQRQKEQLFLNKMAWNGYIAKTCPYHTLPLVLEEWGMKNSKLSSWVSIHYLVHDLRQII